MGKIDAQTPNPHISVIIPTCNRPDDVRRCLDSLATVVYPCWDVLLVDQSDDTRSYAVAEEFAERLPRLVYRHMDRKGLSRARNIGIAETTGEIVAFLDDDCTIEAGWLDHIADVFSRYPRTALVFGAVKSMPHDWRTRFVPVFDVTDERILRGRLAALAPLGMGASMYLRRTSLRRIGPFDVCLGVGSGYFRSSEDWDYCYRILASGQTVVLTPLITVRHFGARDFAGGGVTRLIRESVYSDGAADMKLLRCGDVAALALIAGHLWRGITKIDLRNIALRRAPSGLAWNVMYVRGILASFRLKVDPRQRVFVAP
jgi:glycosyltransferase involved in cell wall biosynthesis